jgi:hypothetical protein
MKHLRAWNSTLSTNANLWCRAFSFFRTNKVLKSLVVGVQYGATDSCLSAFQIDIAAMLQEKK